MKLPSGLVKYAKLLAIARGSSLNLKRRLKPAATACGYLSLNPSAQEFFYVTQ